MEAILRASRDALVITGKNGEIKTTNDAFSEIFQKNQSEVLDESLIDFLFEIEGSENSLGLRRLIKHLKINTFVSEEYEIVVSSDPRWKTLRVKSFPFESVEGESRRIWRFADISNEREVENELRQAQKMETVGQLAMGIAHDFNNILTAITGNLSILKMELDTQRLAASERGNLEFAIQAGRRATELVKQLLGFSRRENSCVESYDPGKVIREIKSILVASIDPSIKLETKISKDLWLAKGDANMLSQVLLNMGKNACDAMQDGGWIRFSAENAVFCDSDETTEPVGRTGDFVRLTVSDDGVGMEAEVIDKIFDPFYTTKKKGRGTGLGLSTSQKVVKQMGGWISVSSIPLSGTQFDIYLPRGKRASSIEEKPITENVEFLGATSTPKETILIVDDEEAVRMVAVSLLKRIGYKVLVASNGQEALEIYGERRDDIDLILLDLTMPELSGQETFTLLRREYDPVPVLICSGYLVDVVAFEAKTGFCPNGFIQKPYRVELMAKSIRDVLDGKIEAA